MQITKMHRIIISIFIGIMALSSNGYLMYLGFEVPFEFSNYLAHPQKYMVSREKSREPDFEKRRELNREWIRLDEAEKLREERGEYNLAIEIRDVFLINLFGGIIILLALAMLPLGIMLVCKVMKSPPLMGKYIQYTSSYILNKSDIHLAETKGIYEFKTIDDRFFTISKAKLKRKLIRSTLISFAISVVSFMTMGISGAAFLIGVYCLVKLFLPPSQLILDRLNGRVIYKGNLTPGFNKPFETIAPALINGELMAFSHPIFEYSILAFGEYGQNTWSFYLQYMDKNRPLPAGNVFDEYREKDFERRKSEGHKAPIYPSSKYICDANSGYVNGTEEFKKEIKAFKLKIEDAHAKILHHIEKDGQIVVEPYKLCFLGLYQDQMVFKYMNQPTYDDLEVFKSDKKLVGCYLIHKKTYKITTM
jgi:hypothetical protein